MRGPATKQANKHVANFSSASRNKRSGSKCHQTPFSYVVLTIHKTEEISDVRSLTLSSSRAPKERGDLLSLVKAQFNEL